MWHICGLQGERKRSYEKLRRMGLAKATFIFFLPRLEIAWQIWVSPNFAHMLCQRMRRKPNAPEAETDCFWVGGTWIHPFFSLRKSSANWVEKEELKIHVEDESKLLR